MKILRVIAISAITTGFAVTTAGAAHAATPAPSQDWNKGCAANGALISQIAKLPGSNTGYAVPAGAPNNAGQSIVGFGKSGVCHGPNA